MMERKKRSNKRWFLIAALLLLMTFATATVFAFWSAGLLAPSPDGTRAPDFQIGRGLDVQSEFDLGDVERTAACIARGDSVRLVPVGQELTSYEFGAAVNVSWVEFYFTVEWVEADSAANYTEWEGTLAPLHISHGGVLIDGASTFADRFTVEITPATGQNIEFLGPAVTVVVRITFTYEPLTPANYVTIAEGAGTIVITMGILDAEIPNDPPAGP